jgi:Ras-related protein Rab-11A
VEFLTKILEVDGQKVKAQIWDTAGQERYNSMMSTYYRKAKGAVLVYDISDPKSFADISRWQTELQEQGDPELVMMLVGNKADLDSRKVSRENGQEYAERHEMAFEETSAKTGQNVQKAFTDLLTTIYRRKQAALNQGGTPAAQPKSVNLSDKQAEKKNSCC